MKKIKMRIFLLLSLLLMVACSGFYYISERNIFSSRDEVAVENITVERSSEEKIKTAETMRKKKVIKKIKTKEDIRKEYGRLEVVYLYSGKIYEGAVTSIDDVYTMVTVNGTVRIPMVEVRARDIIR
ncbi:MAG TPA: hypothetical protein PK358_11750 [Spirochaetota bacterium]|nr:hypothetical protein [Spirochaetota bacterium]HPJ35504.1 hypothetical protein [Spirochaetota bacterium]